MVDRQIEKCLDGVQPTSLLRAIHAKFFLHTPALFSRRRGTRLELRLRLWTADNSSFNNLGNAACQECRSLHVKFATQGIRRILRVNRNACFTDDVPGVQTLVHKMHCYSPHFLSVVNLPESRRLAAIFRHFSFVQIQAAKSRDCKGGSLQDACSDYDSKIRLHAAKSLSRLWAV